MGLCRASTHNRGPQVRRCRRSRTSRRCCPGPRCGSCRTRLGPVVEAVAKGGLQEALQKCQAALTTVRPHSPLPQPLDGEGPKGGFTSGCNG